MRDLTRYRLLIHRLRSTGLRKSADEVSTLYNLVKTSEKPLSVLSQYDTVDHVGEDDDKVITIEVTLGDVRAATNILGNAPGSALKRSG